MPVSSPKLPTPSILAAFAGHRWTPLQQGAMPCSIVVGSLDIRRMDSVSRLADLILAKACKNTTWARLHLMIKEAKTEILFLA